MNEQDPLRNAASQIDPGAWDKSKTLGDNLYDRMEGFNPLPTSPATATVGTPTPKAPEQLEFLKPKAEDYEGFDLESLRTAVHNQVSEGYSNVSVDNDVWMGLEKGFYSSESMFDNIGTNIQIYGARAAQNIGLEGLAKWFASDWQAGYSSTRGGWHGLYNQFVSPAEIYGNDWRSMTGAEMKDAHRDYHKNNIEQWYGGIETNAFAEGGGWFLGQLLDPSSLIAFAKGGYIATKLAMAGKSKGVAEFTDKAVKWGALAGAESVLYQDVVEGRVSPGTSAGVAVLGGLLGAATPFVLRPVARLWDRRVKTGTLMNQSEVDDIIQNEGKRLRKALTKLNESEVKADPHLAAAKVGVQKELEDRILALDGLDKKAIRDRLNTAVGAGKGRDAAMIVDDELRRYLGVNKNSTNYTGFIDRAHRDRLSTFAEDLVNSVAWNKLSGVDKKIVMQGVKDRIKFQDKIDEYGYNDIPKLVGYSHRKFRNDQEAMKFYDNNIPGLKHPGDKKTRVLSSADNDRFRQASAEEVELMTDSMIKEGLAILNKHRVEYKYNVFRHHTSAALGAGIGGIAGGVIGEDDDSMLLGMMIGGGIAWGAPIAKHFTTKYGLGNDLISVDPATRAKAQDALDGNFVRSLLHGFRGPASGSVFSMPINQMERRGGASTVMAHMMRNAEEQFKNLTAIRLADYEAVMIKNGIKPGDDVVVGGILDKTLTKNSPGVRKEHLEAAKGVRKLYNQFLKDAVHARVIPKERAAQLMKAAQREGYVNRIYNINYLKSPKGQAHFERVLAGYKFSEDEARNLIRSVAGDVTKSGEDSIIKVAKRGKEYYFDNAAIKALLSNTNRQAFAPSNFLEKERKIPTALQAPLRDFLITDLRANFTSYAQSVAKRNAYAEYFGANDEIALGLADRIRQEWGPDSKAFKPKGSVRNAGDQAMQDYHGARGSIQNEYLEQYLKSSATFKKANEAVQWWQNTKMVAAAPLNFTQHIIMPPVLLNRLGYKPSEIAGIMRDSVVSSMKDVLSVKSRRGGKDGIAFVDRTGSMLDSIVYSITGDISRSAGHMNQLGTLGMIKDPGFILRLSGFTAAEHWNRLVSARVGEWAVADTLARKQELLLKQVSRRGLSKQQTTELADINNRLMTLGLNPEQKIEDYTIQQVNGGAQIVGGMFRDVNAPWNKMQAAQRLNNMTNFQSDYMHKPRWWNTPYGSWFGKFRNFALHGFNFVHNNVMKPLANGDPAPLAMYLLTMLPAGVAVTELRELARNDDKERTLLKQLLDSISLMGTLGIYGDAINQVAIAPTNLAEQMAGPIYSDFVGIAEGTAQGISDGDMQAAIKEIASTFGFMKYGAGLVTRATGESNPFAEQAKKQQQQKLLDLGLGSMPTLPDELPGL